MVLENRNAVEQYLRKLSGQEKSENVDHNYNKHWSAHPDSYRTKPAVMLFMNLNHSRNTNVEEYDEDLDIEIDVVADQEQPLTPFDSEKAKVVTELEQLVHIKCSGRKPVNEDDLKHVSYFEKLLYFDVMKIIDELLMVHIVYAKKPHEVVKKKNFAKKCSKYLLRVFQKYMWETDLVRWLNVFVLSKCPEHVVISYLKILQEICVNPTVCEMLKLTFPNSSMCGSFQCDYLFEMLIRESHSNPVLPILSYYKSKKLSGNPIIVFSAPGIHMFQRKEPHRFKVWISLLSSICKTVSCIPVIEDTQIKSISDALDDAVLNLQTKVVSLLNHFPQRPIILAGWHIGALVACHVALGTQVAAVLCLGFTLTGVNGSRGVNLNDPFLDIKVPSLFIVGQNSSTCSIDDIEDFRSRMTAETSLVVVGGADNDLCIPPAKMLQENITQDIVDRCILDEIADFIQMTVITKSPPAVTKYTVSNCPTIIEEKQSNKRKRGRRKESSSSVAKRGRQVTKVQHVTKKSRQSSSSSERSSSGSNKFAKKGDIKREEPHLNRKSVASTKNNPRITIKLNSKLITKPFQKSNAKYDSKFDSFKREYSVEAKNTSRSTLLAGNSIFKKVVDTENYFDEETNSESQTLNLKRTDAKSKVPFALHILPKKNDPVDVAKAFGKDSSFLPCPLILPEPEDTVSAEETEKVVSELEKSYVSTSESLPISNSESVSTNVLSSEKALISAEVSTNILSTKTSSASIIKPVFPTSTESRKGISISGFKTVFHQGNILKQDTNPNTKISPNISLIRNKSSSLNPSKSAITVPLNSTLVVPSSTVKTQSTKIIQLLPKRPMVSKSKDVFEETTSKVSRTVEQACNLSLLSDVAGMKEPLKDTYKKLDTASSPATLVKLAVPQKSQIYPSKTLQILKTVQPRSSRIETPEEMKEKQIAVQSLRNIGLESSKEPGYSICYTTADGSVVSQPVLKKATYVPRQTIPSSSKLKNILQYKLYKK